MKRERKKRDKKKPVSLQLTSLMDVFTIMLIFLLKSYSVQRIKVDTISNLKLPKAFSGVKAAEAQTVFVTRKAIIFDGKKIARIVKDKVKKSDLSELTVRNLKRELVKKLSLE